MADSLQESPDFGPKLTTWAKEPTLQELKLDWESAKPSHDLQVGKINRWNDLLRVEGSAAIKKIKGRSSVQPKLVRRQAEWRYSALTEPFLGTDKLFKISPATFEDTKASQQNELLLNHQFRTQINRVQFIDNYVRADVDEGTAIIRVGWKRATAKVKTEVPLYEHVTIEDEEGLEQFKQMMAAALQDPRTFNETAPPELKAALDYFEESGQATVAQDSGKTETVETIKILENRPTAEIMNPQNVVIDPSCNGDFDRAMFVGVTFETSKAELLKEGKRYKNLDQVIWENSTPLSQPDHHTTTPDNFSTANPLTKKVVCHEYWGYHDINKDDVLVPIVVSWIGNVIIRMEENPFPDEKLPFIVVPYSPVKRALHGEPDAELLEDNQAIAGAVSRGMIDLLGRSANGQQGFAKGLLDPLNRKRFEDGKDYEFNPNVPIQSGHVQHKYPEIPQSAMLMLSQQNNEAEALTGVKSFAGGVSGDSYGDVAAGVRGAMDAASKREMAILRRLAKGIQDLGSKIIAMNAVFLSEEEVVRITNSEFVTIKREDLKGNFDLKVDISTAEVDNAQAQDLAFMLQTMGPNMGMEMSQLILSEIAKLKRMPELAHKIANFQPQPDPVQEKLKKLELKKLEMEIAKLESEVGLNEAKEEKTSAEADAANLDFVETETGTKHARDMEKTRGQAQGNMDLEVTKALVKPKKEGERDGDIESAIGFAQLANKKDNESNIGGTPLPPAPAQIAEPPMDILMDPEMMAEGPQLDDMPSEPGMSEQDPSMGL